MGVYALLNEVTVRLGKHPLLTKIPEAFALTIEGRIIAAQLANKVKCKAQVALATEKGGQE